MRFRLTRSHRRLRLSYVAFLVVLANVSCGSAPAPQSSGAVPGGGECRNCPQNASQAEEAETDWHPDADGDGVPRDRDVCPRVYDPEQADRDGDGIGDACEEGSALDAGGAIADLQAQHVTPYGGWFGFRSPKTSEWGHDYVIAWSTEEREVASAAAIRKLPGEQKHVFRVFAYKRMPIGRPQIITGMIPKTKYYVRVAPLDDYDKPIGPLSNTSVITTAAAPALTIPTSSPRVLATPEQLEALATRHKRGDKSLATWSQVMDGSVIDAARRGSEHDFGECLSAALLYHAGGKAAHRDAALALVEAMRAYWQTNELKNNQLRWADANLALCADLMWKELSAPQRNAIVSAFLDDDEAADISRMVDTDEFASITRTWIVDGLVGCENEGVRADLSERSCKLLDKGLRAFYGVQLVKARRSQGFFAGSGGNLPDGIGYAFGTSTYWLKTLIALGNVGADVNAYAPWIWNNLAAMQIHSLTPMKRGYATFGDLDSYDNFSVEPNSHPILNYNGGLIAMHMGLLERAGEHERAGHARWHLDNIFPKDDFGGTWAMLLFAHDGIAQRPDAGLPLAFFDKAMGMLFERTSWEPSASYLTFRAGWSGADHSHEDAGAFQLYRKGHWVTHEALGYDGPAASAGGHNVPALEIAHDKGAQVVGQFRLDPSAPPRVVRRSQAQDYAHIEADLTGAYTSGRHHSFSYEEVSRHIFWAKPMSPQAPDRLIVYDRVKRSADAPGAVGWQLHVAGPAEVAGSRATFSIGTSRAQISLLAPEGAQIAYEPPAGVHSKYPGERYTHRLTSKSDQSSNDVHWVSVLHVDESKTPSNAQAFETNEAIAVRTESDLIIFPKKAAGFPSHDVVMEIPSRGIRNVYWTGLVVASPYTVTAAPFANGVRLTLARGGAKNSDAGGVMHTAIER